MLDWPKSSDITNLLQLEPDSAAKGETDRSRIVIAIDRYLAINSLKHSSLSRTRIIRLHAAESFKECFGIVQVTEVEFKLVIFSDDGRRMGFRNQYGDSASITNRCAGDGRLGAGDLGL